MEERHLEQRGERRVHGEVGGVQLRLGVGVPVRRKRHVEALREAHERLANSEKELEATSRREADLRAGRIATFSDCTQTEAIVSQRSGSQALGPEESENLSVGAVMTLVNTLASHVLNGSPFEMFLGFLACVAAGAACGFVNGCVVDLSGLPLLQLPKRQLNIICLDAANALEQSSRLLLLRILNTPMR